MWIEINIVAIFNVIQHMSLPLRECGLKFWFRSNSLQAVPVTPLAGVWIEIIFYLEQIKIRYHVTPLAGVWIEMLYTS